MRRTIICSLHPDLNNFKIHKKKLKWFFLNVHVIFPCKNKRPMRWRWWQNTLRWWRCGRSCFSAMMIGFQLESLVHRLVVENTYTFTKCNLHWTFRNVTTAYVRECLYIAVMPAYIQNTGGFTKWLINSAALPAQKVDIFNFPSVTQQSGLQNIRFNTTVKNNPQPLHITYELQKYVHKKTYFKTAYKINYKEQSYSTLWCQCRCTIQYLIPTLYKCF